MRVIAIDPGWNGAAALFINDKLEYTERCPTDRSIHKMSQIIHKMIDNDKRTQIFIEKVWSRPYERGAFSFGTNFGAWLGIIASHNIVELQITPRVWQKIVGIRIPKDYKKLRAFVADKGFSRGRESIADLLRKDSKNIKNEIENYKCVIFTK